MRKRIQFILCFCCFLVITTHCTAQNKNHNIIRNELVEIDLNRIEISDSSFIAQIDSLVLNKRECEDCVYYTIVKRDSSGYRMDIGLLKPSMIEFTNVIGIFEIKNFKFVLEGDLLKNMTLLTNKERLSFYKKTISLENDIHNYDFIMPQNPPSWYFRFDKGRLYLIRSMFVP